MPRLRHRSFALVLCGALVPALAIVACSKPSPSSSGARFLGKWILAADTMDRGSLELFASGSCDLNAQGIHYCRWATESDGKIVLHYGLFLPLNTAHAQVSDDEMTLAFGADAVSNWALVRAGSQKEQDAVAYVRGNAFVESGQYEKAMAEWTPAADHDYALAQNGLAWLYATAKRPELHDGKKAVAYAEKAIAKQRHFLYLDTFAASLARDNQFERAITIEEEALALLEQNPSWPGQKAAVTRFKNRLALYRAGQPYTEP